MPQMIFVNLPVSAAMSATRSILIALAAFVATAVMIAGSGGAPIV